MAQARQGNVITRYKLGNLIFSDAEFEPRTQFVFRAGNYQPVYMTEKELIEAGAQRMATEQPKEEAVDEEDEIGSIDVDLQFSFNTAELNDDVSIIADLGKSLANLMFKVRKETLERVVKLSEEIELNGEKNHSESMDEWKAFKHLRNVLVDDIQQLEKDLR
jgi:hypothetical protein